MKEVQLGRKGMALDRGGDGLLGLLGARTIRERSEPERRCARGLWGRSRRQLHERLRSLERGSDARLLGSCKAHAGW